MRARIGNRPFRFSFHSQYSRTPRRTSASTLDYALDDSVPGEDIANVAAFFASQPGASAGASGNRAESVYPLP